MDIKWLAIGLLLFFAAYRLLSYLSFFYYMRRINSALAKAVFKTDDLHNLVLKTEKSSMIIKNNHNNRKAIIAMYQCASAPEDFYYILHAWMYEMDLIHKNTRLARLGQRERGW